MKKFIPLFLAALFLAPAAHAYDQARCEPILRNEGRQMHSCVEQKCKSSEGQNWTYAGRAACMARCAAERSELYQSCYAALNFEFEKNLK